MEWVSYILKLVGSLPVKAKVGATFIIIVLVAGYFYLDRFLDYREAVDLNQPKRVIRSENSLKEYGVKYSEVTTSYPDNRKDFVKKAQMKQ
mgnify:FL=1